MRYRILYLILLFPFLSQGGTSHSRNSVLSAGTWYKYSVRNSGIHQITYNDLVKMGLDPSSINPADIRIFSNGSGMIPESNATPRTDDLREIAIKVQDGGDGRFDPQDYIIFYGESPDSWIYNKVTHTYYHSKNLYSDVTFYFLTVDNGPGKRINLLPAPDSVAKFFSIRYDDLIVNDQELVNLIKSGKMWVGEKFDKSKTRYDFTYSLPDIDSLIPVKYKMNLVARSDKSTGKIVISFDGTRYDSVFFDSVILDQQGPYAVGKTKSGSFNHPKKSFRLSLEYNVPTDASLAWIDFFELQVSRQLQWREPGFPFRDIYSPGPGKYTEFRMKHAKPGITVWDITDMANVSEIPSLISDSILKFTVNTDSLRTFYAFDGSQYDTVKFEGKVPNQNLHSLNPRPLVIVTPESLVNEAKRLSDFHSSHNQIESLVVTVSDIFNEFSCSQPDPGGIRDFIKMLYDRRQSGEEPKYVILFGDGSYDPKNRVRDNNNLIPALESMESLSTTASFVTDDFYGIMGELEGNDAAGTIEIGVGRFPVTTPEQAGIVVDKIIHYSGSNDTILSDWRNVLAFPADDGYSNYFITNTEVLTSIVGQKYPFQNVNKIYFDAFPRVKIPAGSRYPEANKALNTAVEKGTLVINYIGHGGESGWSNSQVLTMTDINSWTNANKLPVIVTATCEFSRFDNPERFSAGEEIFTMKGGGGIALFSTTRTTYAGTNQNIDTSFFKHLMDTIDGKYIRMGELIRLCKNNNSNQALLRNFVLLGDPVQAIAFPEYNVTTTEINGKPAGDSDTAMGLDRVRVSGMIEDIMGNPVSSFNGVMSVRIYDKPDSYYTLGNTCGESQGSCPIRFVMQDQLMSNIRVPVQDGHFSFTFLVPKGVNLNFGYGKLSYYAQNGKTDAKGLYNRLVFGGRDPSVIPETRGPEIALFMDDRSFVPGGRTGTDPLLIADLHDTSGINCTGFGIGHDIQAALDGDWAHSVILNDFFIPEPGVPGRGSLTYRFSGLSPGLHKLTLKAWDLYDNSSEKDLMFWVYDPAIIIVQNIYCYPNPAGEMTTFTFNPKDIAGGADIIIEITSISGVKVRTLATSFMESQGLLPQIPWDLTDDGGNKLHSGLYPFIIRFKAYNGAYTQASGKIVILR